LTLLRFVISNDVDVELAPLLSWGRKNTVGTQTNKARPPPPRTTIPSETPSRMSYQSILGNGSKSENIEELVMQDLGHVAALRKQTQQRWGGFSPIVEAKKDQSADSNRELRDSIDELVMQDLVP
jgi:hypothetical protein